MSSYALFSVIISLIGLTIFAISGASPALKYYFFRFSDIMLPFVTLLNVVSFLIDYLEKSYPQKEKQMHYLGIAICLIFIIPKVNYFASNSTLSIQQIKTGTNTDVHMTEWVKKHTDKNSVFIAPPDDMFFYINYERALFVSWKHSPQSASDMVEWHNRLKMLNCGNEFKNLQEVKHGYFNLTSVDISNITDKYPNIDYFITSKTVKLDYPVLFESSQLILYDIKSKPSNK